MAKYRINPFTGELDDSGAIVGRGPVRNNASSAQELGDLIEDQGRFYFIENNLTNIYVDQDNGDDKNDGSTTGTAIKTLKKAYQLIPVNYRALVTVNLASSASAYTYNTSLTSINNVKIVGELTDIETRNITAVDFASNTQGLRIRVDGAELSTDEWAGRRLKINGVLANRKDMLVVRNVWNGSENVIYGSMISRSGFRTDEVSSPAGGTVTLVEETELNVVGNESIVNCSDLEFENVNFTGDTINLTDTSGCVFSRCRIEMEVLNSENYSNLQILSCSVANAGSSLNAVLAAQNDGTLRVGFGSVIIDTRIDDPSDMGLLIKENSTLQYQGGVIYRGLDGNGINLNGSRMAQFTSGGTQLSVIFENETGTASCSVGYVINNNGDEPGDRYVIRKGAGEVLSDYYVTAQLGARIELESGTSVTTNTVTNAVSVDDGTTNKAIAADGTRISGGAPDVVPFIPGGSLFTSTTAVGNIGGGEDDLITYTMPANTFYSNGDRVEVVAAGTAQGTETVKLYLGSTAILTHTFSGASAKDWKITATIIKSGTGAQKAITNLIDGGGSNIDTEYTSVSEDETTNLIIKCTGQGTSNDDIVQELMTVNWFSSP